MSLSVSHEWLLCLFSRNIFIGQGHAQGVPSSIPLQLWLKTIFQGSYISRIYRKEERRAWRVDRSWQRYREGNVTELGKRVKCNFTKFLINFSKNHGLNGKMKLWKGLNSQLIVLRGWVVKCNLVRNLIGLYP